jgi:hypothetical protein
MLAGEGPPYPSNILRFRPPMNTRIQRIHARQVLDSRGRPTVEADVTLAAPCV